jgi:hypothetical protein
MVAVNRLPPDSGSPAANYFANGYASVADFLAAAKDCPLRLFEPNPAVSIDHGPIRCTQAERRHGKRGLMKWALREFAAKPLDYFEFGVMSCKTFNRVLEWSPAAESRFYGFDTFAGLPEPWVRQGQRGTVRLARDSGELAAAHPPAVYDRRARLFKGLFQDTLPDMLPLAFPAGRQAGRPLFVNIDSDLYSAALYVLTALHPLLRSGDYVYFDEFFDAMNEFSAFNDYIRAYNSKGWFTPIARAYDGLLFRVDVPPLGKGAAQTIERASTSFLERMKAYARTRASLLKPNFKGR